MKGLNAIGGKMQSWGKGIMVAGAGVLGLGASITAALIPAVAKFSELGSELSDMSQRTGVAAGSLAELKFAAEQSGTSLEAVEKALIRMGKEGIDPKLFDQYAASIAAMEDPAQRISKAMEVWGKSGAELIPMLAELQALRQEARDLGLVPTQRAVELAAKLGDAWDKFTSVMSAALFNTGAALAEAFLPMIESITKISANVSRWIQKNGQLVRTVAVIGAGLTVVGGIIVGIGAAFVGVGAIISGIATVLGFLATPAGAVVVAVVAIGTALVVATGYWLLFTESGQKCAKALKVGFQKTFEYISSAIKGISDALMAGDIALAAAIAAKSMEVPFMKAIDAIIERMHGLFTLLPIPAGPLAALRGGDRAQRAEQELEILKGMAESRRDAAWGASDDQKKYGMESMKSLGSFNPYALSLQNYGAGGDKKADAVKRAADKIIDELFPELIRSVKDSSTKWSQ